MGAVGGDAKWCLGRRDVPINCKKGMRIIITEPSGPNYHRRALHQCFQGILSASNKSSSITGHVIPEESHLDPSIIQHWRCASSKSIHVHNRTQISWLFSDSIHPRSIFHACLFKTWKSQVCSDWSALTSLCRTHPPCTVVTSQCHGVEGTVSDYKVLIGLSILILSLYL